MKEVWGVSGSHGFIGSNLVRRLEEDNQEVKRINHAGFVPQVDRIIDLASYGNIYNQTNPAEIYQANVMRVIELLRTCGSAKSIILTSSSSVELSHQTLYSASKKAMEQVSQLYARDKNLPITIIRPFSVYGVGEQKEHLIPKLIDSCLNGTEMPFVGEPTHDWIYIDDFVNLVRLVSVTMSTPPGAVVEARTGIQTSNEKVKDIVEKVTGKKANLVRVENMRKYDSTSWGHRQIVEEPIDSSNMVSLEEGIRRMVNDKR